MGCIFMAFDEARREIIQANRKFKKGKPDVLVNPISSSGSWIPIFSLSSDKKFHSIRSLL
jgi:hypothetical protein